MCFASEVFRTMDADLHQLPTLGTGHQDWMERPPYEAKGTDLGANSPDPTRALSVRSYPRKKRDQDHVNQASWLSHRRERNAFSWQHSVDS